MTISFFFGLCICSNIKSCFFFNENKGPSKYVGVYWNKERKKWKASFFHKKEHIYIASFENEKDAAKAVNWKCGELKISMKNPELGSLDIEAVERLKLNVIGFLSFIFMLLLREDGGINVLKKSKLC